VSKYIRKDTKETTRWINVRMEEGRDEFAFGRLRKKSKKRKLNQR
jgi:hypothetical protein